MKKLMALLLALLLMLTFVPAAGAEPDGLILEVRDANLNKWSNTVSVKDDDAYWRLINLDGEELVPASEKYTSMYPDSSYPFFKVEVEAADGLHNEGLIDGFGKLLVPAKYADVNVISERWQSGVLLTPSDAENKDYTVTNYSTDEKSYYQIDAVDFYFDGAYVGSLSRSEYGNGFVTAYGAYITLTDIYGERHFYNKALELSPYESSYSSEYDSVYQAGSTINYHQGSGQIAFTPECTLDPADVENPYYYEKGVVYSINGEELLQTADYDYVRSFRDGYTVVTVDSKKGLLSVTDGEIIAPEYDDLGNSEEHPLRFGYISAVKDGKFGFLNAEGQVTAPFTYSKDVVHNYSDFATVKDLDGSIIVISAAVGELPTRYSDVSFPFYDGCMAFIAENAEGQSAVIDLYGRELLPFSDSYRSIYLSVDGTAALVYCGYQQYVIYQFDVSQPDTLPLAAAAEEDGWTCENGHSGNQGNFCSECGSPRPEEGAHTCPSCGYELSEPLPTFCPNCGKPIEP